MLSISPLPSPFRALPIGRHVSLLGLIGSPSASIRLKPTGRAPDTTTCSLAYATQRYDTERSQHRRTGCHSTKVGRGTNGFCLGWFEALWRAALDSDMATKSSITSLISRTRDEDRIVIHEYTPMLAFWAKPAPGLRFNFDWEQPTTTIQSCASDLVRKTRYRIQGNYTPKPWTVIGRSINLWKASNGDGSDGLSRAQSQLWIHRKPYTT